MLTEVLMTGAPYYLVRRTGNEAVSPRISRNMGQHNTCYGLPGAACYYCLCDQGLRYWCFFESFHRAAHSPVVNISEGCTAALKPNCSIGFFLSLRHLPAGCFVFFWQRLDCNLDQVIKQFSDAKELESQRASP